MSSLESEDIDKYLLTDEENERIFQQKIKPKLFENIIRIENPSGVIFGGQPGAGKSMSVSLAEEALKALGGSVSILGDDLRAFHPENDRLMAIDDKTAAFFTGKDAGRWVEKSVDYAKKIRCNVIIEGTMRSPETIARTMKIFKNAGYFVDARALAVPERLSWQGVLQRYENQRLDRGAGRMTLPEAHREAYDGLLASLEKVEREKLADRISIYTRGAVILYENHLENGQWKNTEKARQVVEQERNRPWTLPERFNYAKGFDRLAELLQRPQRNASTEEVEAVEKLRKAAYQDISICEKQAIVVQETAKAVIAEKVKNPEIADMVMVKIEQELEKRIKENTVPKVSIYDKNVASKEPVLEQAIPGMEPEHEKGRDR